MKIGIVTIFKDLHNFGQRLLNYALSKTLISKNHNVNTIVLDKNIKLQTYDRKFKEFDDNFLSIHMYHSASEIKADDFDMFVIGSDQVFNPIYESADLNLNTLPFIPRNKKITYAASDGYNFYSKQNILNINNKKLFNKICTIDHLSFREKNTYETFKSHSLKNVYWHIDPVFLLTANNWNEIAKKPSFVNAELFTVSYILHLSKNQKIADKLNAHLKKSDVKNYDLALLLISPAEFIWLIKNATSIYTNSFHAYSFGIIFEKDVKYLGNNDNRLDSLFQMLNIKIDDDMKIINYDEIHACINYQRELSNIYLDKYLVELPSEFQQCQYVGYSKDENIRNISSSGGITGVIAKFILDNGGIVYGASYSNDYKSVITIPVYNSCDYFKLLAKSKYSYCRPPKFKDIKDKLDHNINVLYIGPSCYILALKHFLKKDYLNLYTISFSCFGYTKPNILKKFIEENEKHFKSKTIMLDMRRSHSTVGAIKFENGLGLQFDTHKVFLKNDVRCQKCITCNHTTCADINVGDFWNYTKDYPQDYHPLNGCNIFSINTTKGSILFDNVKNEISHLKFKENI